MTIGDNVLMGQRVSLHSQNHNFDDVDASIKAQGVSSKGIVIEDGCWLGSGAIILDGVHLGAGTVVAAGAVVTRSFGPDVVIGGNPARILRERGARRHDMGDDGVGEAAAQTS